MTHLSESADVTVAHLPAAHDRGLVFFGSVPCDIWLDADRRYCGDGPTRRFAQGCRCVAHTPAAVEARAAKAAVDDYTPTPVDDYNVTFMWSPGMADVVLEVAPYADPEWEIPPDHPLALCEGQDSLFGPDEVSRLAAEQRAEQVGAARG